MNKIYTIILVLLAFASCNPMDDIYDNLDSAENIVSKKVELTMADADYKKTGEFALARKTKADSLAGTKIKDKKYFANDAKIAEYLPAFLDYTYPGLQKNSSAMVTYNYFEGAYPSLKKVDASIANYKNAGGEGANYFCFSVTPDVKTLAKLVSVEMKDGDLVLLTYKRTEQTAGKTQNVFDFTMDKYDYTTLFEWVKKEKKDFIKDNAEYWFGTNTAYRNFDGRVKTWKEYSHTETVNDAFIISQIQKGIKLLLETKYAQKSSEKQATIGVTYNVRYAVNGNPNIPLKQAFVCTTAGAKPVFELAENSVDAVQTTDFTGIYQYNEKYKELSLVKNGTLVVTKEDFEDMNLKYPEFSSSTSADDYIPQLLAQKYIYAQPEDEIVVAYRYDGGKNYSLYTDRYIFTNGTWAKYNPVIVKTDQFIYAQGKWAFDPTVHHTMVKEDYEMIVNWVKDNKNAYYDAKYQNAEYWFGASFFKNNFDIRLATRISNDKDGVLKDKTDTEVMTYLNEQIQKGIVLFLETTYPTAEPQKDGLDMYYKITYLTFDGSNHDYVVTYKCISTGKFELSENPVEL